VGSEKRSCVHGKLQTPKFGYILEIVVRYDISFAVSIATKTLQSSEVELEWPSRKPKDSLIFFKNTDTGFTFTKTAVIEIASAMDVQPKFREIFLKR